MIYMFKGNFTDHSEVSTVRRIIDLLEMFCQICLNLLLLLFLICHSFHYNSVIFAALQN